ncbi:MAG: M14 family zinc carboxypeptidase [Planctomycetota bacterium]
MRPTSLGPIFLLFVCGLVNGLKAQDEAPALSYMTPAQVVEGMRRLAANAKDEGLDVAVVVMGRSHQGREILALEIQPSATLPAIPASAQTKGLIKRSAGRRPALLIVAGEAGDRLIGTSIAMHLAAKFLELPPKESLELLGGAALYLVPQLNPDGAARYFEGVFDPELELGKRAFAENAGNARTVDWDRDGRSANEDVPVDLDGDGLITMMRIPDPEGAWIAVPDEPRLTKKADVEKGENGTFRYFIESRDRDGDGDYGENPSWGVHLNLNFPRGFKIHDLSSGLHAVSEPETKAILDYVHARPNIAMTLVYGAYDNLAKIPKAAKAPKGGRFRRERPTGIWSEDRALLEVFRKMRKDEGAVLGKNAGSDDGSFAAWSYYQFGVPTLAVNLFEVDTAAKKKESDKKKAKGSKSKSDPKEKSKSDSESKDDEPRDGDADTSKAKSEKKPDPVKEHLSERKQSAFSAWRPFDHPQLGKIEIGGWKPYLTKNPSEVVAGHIARAEFAFMKQLFAKLTKVTVASPVVKQLANGLYEIRLHVVNEGGIPTACKQGAYNRIVGPVLIELDLPKDRLVHGRSRNRVESLAAKAGEFHGRWVIRGKSGDSILIWVAEAKAHPQLKEVVLP